MEKSTLDDIACRDSIKSCFREAKDWIRENAVVCMKGVSSTSNLLRYIDEISYRIEQRTKREIEMPSYEKPVIFVNPKKIREHKQRHTDNDYHGPQLDIKSMFVYEITKYIATKDLNISLAYSLYKTPHQIGRELENINRQRRGLRVFPPV